MPKKINNFLFEILKLIFLRANIITRRVTAETRKRQNKNVNGSIVFNPIFIIGKDVPQRHPASKVKNTAFALLLTFLFGTLSASDFCFLLVDYLKTFSVSKNLKSTRILTESMLLLKQKKKEKNGFISLLP